MKTLFIDSSRKSLSVALASQNKLLLVSNVDTKSKHSNYLVNEIKEIISKSNLGINEIDNIVVLNGPGSFTGIRVGVTVAKTLAWALSKKLYVVSNLKAISLSENNDIVISVIKDKDDYSYVGIYGENCAIENYMSIDEEILNLNDKNITVLAMEDSNYLNKLIDKLKVNNNVSNSLIEEYDYLKVINYALSNSNINVHSAEPIYLKLIDAEKKNFDN